MGLSNFNFGALFGPFTFEGFLLILGNYTGFLPSFSLVEVYVGPYERDFGASVETLFVPGRFFLWGALLNFPFSSRV